MTHPLHLPMVARTCEDFARAAHSQHTRPDMLRQYAADAKAALEMYLAATEPVDLGEEPVGEGCTCGYGKHA